METKGKVLRPNLPTPGQPRGSGRVREYRWGQNRRLFQITTFCPDVVGPGPIHVYLIEDEALILVDAGIPTGLAKNMFYYWRDQKIPEGVARLAEDHSEQELFSALKLIGYDAADIDFILLTHGHPDHYLLAPAILEKSRAKVVAHVLDSAQICNPWWMLAFWLQRGPGLLASGMPLPRFDEESFRSRLGSRPESLALRVDCPIVFEGPLSMDGFRSPRIDVSHFPGHCPGAICLLLRDDRNGESIMLCGDTLLHPITPHPDDLIAYLRTLKRMSSLHNVALTLPAHGDSISKLHQKLQFLQKHHQRRLEFTYEACSSPTSVWQLATMSGFFDVVVDPSKFNPLAGQEALVHIELLQLAGGLRTAYVKDGVHYFQNSDQSFGDVCQRVEQIIDDWSTTALLRR